MNFVSSKGEVTEQKSEQKAQTTVERLRASRAEYSRKLAADAKKTGVEWLQTEATYEQVKYVLWLNSASSSRDALHRMEGGGPLKAVAASVDAISVVPAWCRTEKWYASFIESVLAEWKTIAAEVERDD